MRPVLLYISLFLFSFSGCKSQQYSFEELPRERILFGNGGGMTGASDTYTLMENGQLFHTNSLTEETKELKSIGERKAKACFEQMETLELSEMDFQHPGNQYYFLEAVKGSESKRIVWGAQDYDVPKSYAVLYKELMTNVKTSSQEGKNN